MHRKIKLNIITEAQRNGVSATCEKYNISRTIYYRWLKRYKEMGIDGLDNKAKNFVPVNKTSDEIEQSALSLFKTYPSYGPKAIKYLLEEIGYDISESAVFNIMKRHNLTNKESRTRFAQKGEPAPIPHLPPPCEINSGECWIFWITNYGSFQSIGNIYEYTFYDFRSKIAASRLYKDITFSNMIDLLTGAIFPVAQLIKFDVKYLCFFTDSKLIKSTRTKYSTKINSTFKRAGFDTDIHILNQHDDVNAFTKQRMAYTKDCLSHLMPYINSGASFDVLKLKLQEYTRDYNIYRKISYGDITCSPLEYHTELTNHPQILPIWAYMERPY